MSNYTPGAGPGGNNNSSGHRRDRDGRDGRDGRIPHNSLSNGTTGALPIVNTGRSYTGAFDFEEMLETLHETFTHDRQIASQADSKRCGICYLYFVISDLHYREEEGFYVCTGCEHTLGKQKLPMVRRQQK